jgi:glutaredoxin
MKIKIYSTPTCIYCKKAKQLLNQYNIAFQEINVIASKQTLDDFVKLTKQQTVPVIDVDGKLTVGYDEYNLKKAVGIIS